MVMRSYMGLAAILLTSVLIGAVLTPLVVTVAERMDDYDPVDLGNFTLPDIPDGGGG